jgi:phage gp36-like protein
MALVIDTTPLSPTCNSYGSLAGIIEYVSTRVPNATTVTAWEDLDTEVQSMYLVNATRAIDMYVEWIGDRYSRDQRLDWPRVNAYVDSYLVDQITFPLPVVEATYEMALWMMANAGEVYVDQSSSYDAIKVGPITIDFNQQALGSAKQYFPDIVAAILRDYGTIENPNLPGQMTLKQARLQRA